MMGLSHLCFIPDIDEIGTLVPGKKIVKVFIPCINRSSGLGEKIFEGFLTIYGHGCHLVLVTQIPRTNLHFSYHTGQAISEK